MNIFNSDEAIREASMDIAEGADNIMVKLELAIWLSYTELRMNLVSHICLQV